MNVHIVSQVLRRRQPPTPRVQAETHADRAREEGLYFKDTAGLIIFLLVVFVFLMISAYA